MRFKLLISICVGASIGFAQNLPPTPGDDLMCTVVLREMRKRGRRRVWMMSRFPGLFEGNADVDWVVPFDMRYERMIHWVGGRDWYVDYGGHDHAAEGGVLEARINRRIQRIERARRVPVLHRSDGPSQQLLARGEILNQVR